MTKKPATQVVCDGCGSLHTVIDGDLANDRATLRSADGQFFVGNYGSGAHDGDVFVVTADVPDTLKAICDTCVTRMKASGEIVFTENYLGIPA